MRVYDKRPVEDFPDRPKCFGVSFDPADTYLCASCSWASKCKLFSDAWEKVESIAEVVHNLERKTYNPNEGETVEETYARLHYRWFGRRPSVKSLMSPPAKAAFSFVATWCSENDVAPSTFIAARMWSHRDTQQRAKRRGRNLSFQPNWLSGEKAVKAYRGVMRYARGRYRAATEGILDSHAGPQELLSALSVHEKNVAAYYVASVLKDDGEDWDECVRLADPCREWLSVDCVRRGVTKFSGVYKNLCGEFSTGYMQHVRKLMELRAACEISARYDPRLPCRIGFKKFSWESFAALLKRVVYFRPSDTVSLSGISGELWVPGEAYDE